MKVLIGKKAAGVVNYQGVCPALESGFNGICVVSIGI